MQEPNPDHRNPNLPIQSNSPSPIDQLPPATSQPTTDHDPNNRRIIDTIQTVLTALILAFIFRAFLVEAFIIPTGSMAETLLGEHGTCVCPACAWTFDYAPQQSLTRRKTSLPETVRCPNCQFLFRTFGRNAALKAGDRILVHKWPYALGGPFRPKRWDVIVFRDPANPNQNYIKRLVGLPGDTVEIIAGDLFINSRIARKSNAAQNALWFLVFDQDHFPTPNAPAGNGTAPRWVPADPRDQDWSGLTTRRIRCRPQDNQPHTLMFQPRFGREYLEDFYGYNSTSTGANVPDARIKCKWIPHEGAGWTRWEIVRDNIRFLATIHATGHATLHMQHQIDDLLPKLLAEAELGPLKPRQPIHVEFAHLDFRVYLNVNDHPLLTTTDADYSPDLNRLRQRRQHDPLDLRITVQNLHCNFHNLRIDRDVYYTYRHHRTKRAYAGRIFLLADDEFFVLGDNSPDSHDSREWNRAGPHLPSDYIHGTVQQDQIVGQAAFVYLPGLLPLDANGRWRIPDIGRTRFVR